MLFNLRLKGFTMIELLVVIAVIGILAVALLATLNPLEQIRKGRDTRTRSDASQLASALERYNASLGRFPWQATEGQVVTVGFVNVKTGSVAAADGCTLGAGCVLHNAAGTGVLDQLTSTNEVKSSFIDRISAGSSRDLYLYFNGANTGASVTVCFMPESNTFAREAFDRCKSGNFGADFLRSFGVVTQTTTTATRACPDGANQAAYATLTFDASDADELICLP